MKKITLEITDKAYKRIQSALIVRKMAGMTWGAPDQFVAMIFDALEKGETTKTVRSQQGDDPE